VKSPSSVTKSGRAKRLASPAEVLDVDDLPVAERQDLEEGAHVQIRSGRCEGHENPLSQGTQLLQAEASLVPVLALVAENLPGPLRRPS
jgi:hypothetical protein